MWVNFTVSSSWNPLSRMRYIISFSHLSFSVQSSCLSSVVSIIPPTHICHASSHNDCICTLQHSWFESWNNTDFFFLFFFFQIFHLSTPNVRNYATSQRQWTPHLLVHEYVDERVDDGGELGQQRRHDARLRAQEVSGAEGGEQRRHSVRQPADQVAHHHGDDHHQHPLLSAAAHHRAHAADLGEEKQNRKWRFWEFYSYAWWGLHDVYMGPICFLLWAVYHHLRNYSR